MNPQEQPNQRAEWQSLVEEQEKSGLSQKEFCSVRGLVLSQFVYYRSIFKTKKSETKPDSLFTPVQIKPKEVSVSTEIKIILPNGFQCFVSSLIPSSHLKNLLGALLSC